MSTGTRTAVWNIDHLLGIDDEGDPEENARVAETLDLFQRWMDRVFDDPTLLGPLPDGAYLIFLPEEDAELSERNRIAGLRMR